MLKRLMMLVAALTLAGGVFLTAQAVSSQEGPLPRSDGALDRRAHDRADHHPTVDHGVPVELRRDDAAV